MEARIIPLSDRPVIRIGDCSNIESRREFERSSTHGARLIDFRSLSDSGVSGAGYDIVAELLKRDIVVARECVSCFCRSKRRYIEDIVARGIAIRTDRTAQKRESAESGRWELDRITEYSISEKGLVLIDVIIEGHTNVYGLDTRFIDDRISILITQFQRHGMHLGGIRHLRSSERRDEG